MRVYTVHSDPGGRDEPVLVKEGLCWPAVLFTAFWALWHGLWLIALALLVAEIGLGAALGLLGAGEATRFAAGLGLSLLIGFFANDWRRRALTRRGLWFEGVVAATDADSALRRWCDLHPASHG